MSRSTCTRARHRKWCDAESERGEGVATKIAAEVARCIRSYSSNGGLDSRACFSRRSYGYGEVTSDERRLAIKLMQADGRRLSGATDAFWQNQGDANDLYPFEDRKSIGK